MAKTLTWFLSLRVSENGTMVTYDSWDEISNVMPGSWPWWLWWYVQLIPWQLLSKFSVWVCQDLHLIQLNQPTRKKISKQQDVLLLRCWSLVQTIWDLVWSLEDAITVTMACVPAKTPLFTCLLLPMRLMLICPLRTSQSKNVCPLLADLKPSGQYVFQDLYEVGGVPALWNTSAPASTATRHRTGKTALKTGWLCRPYTRPKSHYATENPKCRRSAYHLERELAPDGAFRQGIGR